MPYISYTFMHPPISKCIYTHISPHLHPYPMAVRYGCKGLETQVFFTAQKKCGPRGPHY